MAKRKKYPKLPNGFGTIRYLGKGRRKPYAVHPPTNDLSKRQPALCYVNDWYTGFTVLNAYKAGTYYDGMEKDVKLDSDDIGSINETINRILNDYSQLTQKISGREDKELTFKEVYEKFYYDKYDSPKSRKYSSQSRDSTRAAYKNCVALHDRIFRNLRYDDLQNIVDTCPLAYSSLELIVTLLKQMYKFAEMRELCDKDYAKFLVIKEAAKDEHGEPFTDDELKILWKNKNNDVVQVLLIMCYSGHRIGELNTICINLDKKVFIGGNKTEAGKNKIVPIHHAILPIVEERINKYGKLLLISTGSFRFEMYDTLDKLNIKKHTPHDCRHTFSMLAEKYGINLADRKRLLGHSMQDITEGVYGHRNINDLRREIERIETPFCD